MFAVACLVSASPLAAQSKGFWTSLGVGSGMQQVACDICLAENNGGWAARLAAGRSLRPNLGVGGEIHVWTDRTDDIRYRFISVTPALYWYPSPLRVPYFLIGGAGFASFHASSDNEVMKSTGVGVTFGLGYDLMLAGRWRLTPFGSYTTSFLAHLMLDRTDVAGAQLRLLQVGVGLTRR